MLRKISIVIICFILIGCYTKYIPEPEMLNIIEKSSIDKNKITQVCIAKSVKYADFIDNSGYDARVIIGGTVGLERPHARVVVVNPETGKEHLIDPTWISGPADGLEIARYNNFAPWVIFEKEVKYEDVKYYRKIIKLYPQNIPNRFRKFFANSKLRSKKFIDDSVK